MTATLPQVRTGVTFTDAAAALRAEWAGDVRWSGIERSFTAEDVVRLRGSVVEEHTLARRGAHGCGMRVSVDACFRSYIAGDASMKPATVFIRPSGASVAKSVPPI